MVHFAAALESFASFNMQGKLTHRDTKHALQSPNVVEPTKFHLVGIGFLRLRHVYLFGKPTSARRESVARQAEAEEASEPSDDSDDETRAPSPDPNDATDANDPNGPDAAAPSSPTAASPQSPAASSSLPAGPSPGMAKMSCTYSLWMSPDSLDIGIP